MSNSQAGTRAATAYRQIRACCPTPDTIVVYQAYRREIANAAVENQLLSASELFRYTRMTWIKPSWAWMLYRAGYSYKDKGQECILALHMKLSDFLGLLEKGVLSTHVQQPALGAGSAEDVEGNAASINTDREQASVSPGRDGDKMDESRAADVAPAAGTPHRPERRKKGEPSLRKPTEDVRIQWDPERTYRLGKLPYRSIQIGIPASLSKEWVENMIVKIEDVTDRARTLKSVLDERRDVTTAELESLGLVPSETVVEVPPSIYAKLRMDVERDE